MEPDSKLNLDILPPEVVVQFLLRLSLKDLANYCQTSKTANAYCESDAFWKDKYRYDFGLSLPVLTEGKKWADIYKWRTKIKNSPISAGFGHYAVIDDRGILYMAGKNDNGQLGDGTQNDTKVPIIIKSFTERVISISCGNNFTMAITEDGKTYGWGDNMLSNENKNFLVPTLIPNLVDHKAVKVSCGRNGWGVILGDGSIYISNQPFIGDEFTRIADKISLEDKIIDISVSSERFAAVTERGKLYFAGETFGQTEENPDKFVGIEMSEGVYHFVRPKHISFPPKRGCPQQRKLFSSEKMIPRIKQVSLTSFHAMALSENGEVFIWGENRYGLLGLPYDLDAPDESDPYLFPQRFPSRYDGILHKSEELITLPKISYISSESETSAVITTDGRLYVWGASEIIDIVSNFQEEDERFSVVNRVRTVLVPVELDIGSKINYIAFGGLFTIASTVDGMVNYMGDDI